MSVVTVYVVFANVEEAMRIGRTMVEEELAACINVLGPCTSIYRWDGAVEQSDETPALFKTTNAAADALIARVAELHSYEVPAIVTWPIDRLSAPFGDWVEESVPVT
jgi:periplasmic divalent cation tolerance protein